MFSAGFIKPFAFGVLAFLASWGFTRAYDNLDELKKMYMDANLAKYESMTYEGNGPAEYYVLHSDYTALEKLAVIEADIVGLKKSTFDRLAKLSVTSAYSGALDRLRANDAVNVVMSTSIPLICH